MIILLRTCKFLYYELNIFFKTNNKDHMSFLTNFNGKLLSIMRKICKEANNKKIRQNNNTILLRVEQYYKEDFSQSVVLSI